MPIGKRLALHIQGEQDSPREQILNAEVFVPFIRALDPYRLGAHLRLGSFKQLAEPETTPVGPSRPALDALHTRVLRFMRKSPQLGDREAQRMIHETLHLKPVCLLIDGRYGAVPHEPEIIFIRLVAGQEQLGFVATQRRRNRRRHEQTSIHIHRPHVILLPLKRSGVDESRAARRPYPIGPSGRKPVTNGNAHRPDSG